MTLIIVTMLLLAYLLIATGHLTGVNKAAIAMFLGTIGWVVYVCWGADFVMAQHTEEYVEWLGSNEHSSDIVKWFIYDHVFLKYVGRAAAIVLFLLATMSIVELLSNNGCFDFITEWIRTRNSKRLLWSITAVTFVLSANLDNLTTATMMLVIMHNILQNSRQRMYVGAAIVLAACCGGCFTVIGDPIGLILWGNGAVTATRFSAYLGLPALLAWVVPTYLVSRELPERLDTAWSPSPYRGDATRLNRWQRVVMLIVGIGGLWFIPTFHNITRLAPFLGASCVLSVLWVVNEAFNHKLINADCRPDNGASHADVAAIWRSAAGALRYGYHARYGCCDRDGCLVGCGRLARYLYSRHLADRYSCWFPEQYCGLLYHCHFQPFSI